MSRLCLGKSSKKQPTARKKTKKEDTGVYRVLLRNKEAERSKWKTKQKRKKNLSVLELKKESFPTTHTHKSADSFLKIRRCARAKGARSRRRRGELLPLYPTAGSSELEEGRQLIFFFRSLFVVGRFAWRD